MRALLITFCICLVMSIGVFTAAAVYVNDAKDKVEYTEEILYGDPAEAADFVITSGIQYDRHLFWITRYPLADRPVTKFKFSAVEKRYNTPDNSYNGVQLQNGFVFGLNMTLEANEQTGLAAAYRSLYDRTPVGGRGREIINLADYYEFYPISAHVDLPGLNAHWDPDTLDRYTDMTGFRLEDFAEFFRIPLMKEEYIEIHVNKSISGGTSWGSGSVDKDFDGYDFWTSSVVAGDGCYITFNNRTRKGNKADTSMIPGGYGIYKLPLKPDEKGKIRPVIEDLAIWYPLDESANLISLYSTKDESKLILFTEEKQQIIMTVIDLTSAKQIQQVAVEDSSVYSLDRIEINDSYILLKYGSAKLQVWEKLGNGTYEKKMDCSAMPPDDDPLNYFYSGSTVSFWDGERLVLSDYLDNNYITTPSFYVSVYRKNQMTYCGKYHSSLTTGYRSNGSSYYCTSEGMGNLVIEKQEK